MQNDELKKKLRAMWMPVPDPEAERAALQTALTVFLKPWRNDFQAEEARPSVPWTWRDWLWPSPFAWSAIAGVWVIVLMQRGTARPHESRLPESATEERIPTINPSNFTACADYQEILKQIEQSKASR